MAIPVEAPKLGNSVEDIIVAKWHKQRGDSVTSGELVAEIETDKATFEVTSPAGGTILETFFPEGALVPVFTNLFVIGTPGEPIDSFRPTAAAAKPDSVPEPSSSPSADAVPLPARAAPPLVATPGAAYSPRARRFSEEHNFRPAAVRGSGPHGRILEQDLREAFYNGTAVPVAVTAAAAPASPPATAAPKPARKPSTLRDKIAQRMRDSLATTAQYTLNSSAAATGLLALRARIKKSSNPRISINDLINWCTVQALLKTPTLNAEYIDGKLVQHAHVNLGFACDTPRGLLVPVIHNAHQRTPAALADTAKTLAAAAAQGNINPDALSGATFTVSNLGNFGIETFTPLLNPPQVAILGVGSIELKPVRGAGGGIEFVDKISLSLTCDHQVIDGAPGARFLETVRGEIENVESRCTI
jgi:pyruvate dehydrogenase E2 component (dihydrolipoamide acetyltransferase)